jgi:hypothetical protein
MAVDQMEMFAKTSLIDLGLCRQGRIDYNPASAAKGPFSSRERDR